MSEQLDSSDGYSSGDDAISDSMPPLEQEKPPTWLRKEDLDEEPDGKTTVFIRAMKALDLRHKETRGERRLKVIELAKNMAYLVTQRDIPLNQLPKLMKQAIGEDRENALEFYLTLSAEMREYRMRAEVSK